MLQYLLEKYGGVDYAIDASGEPAWQKVALKALSPYGALTFPAMTPAGTELTIPVFDIFGKKIIGGFWGNKGAKEAYDKVLELNQSGKFDIDRMVSKKFTLGQINDAIQMVIDDQAIGVIVEF